MATAIPIISIPSPTSEDSGDVHIHQVPRDVPIDVFQEIVAHLQFKDRLSISLISRKIYTALPPRRTHVAVSNIHLLNSFAAYISGDAARASALRSIHIFIDYPLPSDDPSTLEDAQRSTLLILASAINLEELICRGDATSDLIPVSLAMLRRLSHLALQGLPPILVGERPIEGFFPLTLQSLHVTRWYPHIIHSLPLAWILQLVSHLPALDTLTVEHHVFSLFMLQDGADHKQSGEYCKGTPLPVLPSVRTLKLLDCSRGIVHPVFVQKLAKSLPNLATLHFDRTALPGRGSPEYAVDHLVLTNIPYRIEGCPVPWKVRRFTYVLGEDDDRTDFSSPHCRVDLSTMLCLSISAPVIAPRIWDDLTANGWDTRLLELESSVTSFSELVAPLVCISLPDALSIRRSLTPTIVRAADRPPCDGQPCRSSVDVHHHRESERTWERARSKFLRRASAYFPSLRYVAVAMPNQNARVAPIVAYPGDDVHVWTWWRVHRDKVGALVQIMEIPVWEGRRGREFLRDADAETMNDFAHTFTARIPLNILETRS